jgi:hypothetical protein
LLPFRLRTWIKMGFIGWLAGGVVTVSLNVRGPMLPRNFPGGTFPNDPFKDINEAIRSIRFEQLAGVVALLVVVLLTALIVSLIFSYLFSRFRFILFDSVISGQVVIGRGWQRYRDQGNRYFLFWLVFNLATWVALWFIVGVPIWHAYKHGLFQGDQPLFAFFDLLASVALGLLAFGLVAGVISTLAKDFIMPMMALDNLTIGQAFSALKEYIAAEPGAWAGYFGMKLALAFGAGIVLGLASAFAFLVLLLVMMIPAAVLILLGVLAMKAAIGLGIAIFVLTGIAVVIACFCMAFCLMAPVSVFFAAYAFYFFGGRYPRLGGLLWPQPPPPAPPTLAEPATALR